MTDHACTELTPGCYRCGLNMDEIQDWAESLVVTRKGVVHEPDCTFVTGPCSSATQWLPTPAQSDRACSRCLPNGLPGVLDWSLA